MHLGRLISLNALLALLACEGPMGPRGFPGPPAGMDGGTSELDGAFGAPDGSGPDAASVDAGSDLSLRGRVRDATGSGVGSGSVVLVPAARVAALAATPIDFALSGAAAALTDNDEPLEDLHSDLTLPRAAVASDGSFSFAIVPDGEFFVVYAPAAQDSAHLPGGQLARVPQAADALRGRELELRVSGVPSTRARYVGSSSCVTCHARHSLFASAHALTLRVPGVSGPQQEVAPSARLDEALAAFASSTVLSFTDCQGSGADTTCSVRSDAPAAAQDVALQVRLGRDLTVSADAPGRYYVELIRGSGAPVRYRVGLTLGGNRSLQQFVALVTMADGAVQHFVLPFAYQLAGDDTRSAPRDLRWASFRVADWFDAATGALRTPPLARSFERDCAGCHTTGFAVSERGMLSLRGRAVSDAAGSYDLDGDGRKEQLAVGCEACHGPGSEHLEQLPRGQRIVSPALLTPERQNLVCGTCHARQSGKQGELAPLDEQGQMPRAGLARRDFLARHVSRFDAQATFPSGDARVHFQQYGDFLRSPKYRNDKLLVTCGDCHDAHRSSGHASDLLLARPSDTCVGCHARERDVTTHVASKLRFPHDVGVDPARLTCSECHMVRTGSAGAHVPALRDTTDPDPARHRIYTHGDRTSHRFVFTGRSLAAEQPVAATNGCAPCHGEFLPVQ